MNIPGDLHEHKLYWVRELSMLWRDRKLNYEDRCARLAIINRALAAIDEKIITELNRVKQK